MGTFWAATIRNYRLASGLSQKELALHVGVSQKTISRWERGEDPPAVVHQRKLRDVMYKPLDDIDTMKIRYGAGLQCMMRTDNPYHGIEISRSYASMQNLNQLQLTNADWTAYLSDAVVEAIARTHDQQMSVGIPNLAFGNCAYLAPNGGVIEASINWCRVGADHVLCLAGAHHPDRTHENCYYEQFTFDDLLGIDHK